MFNESADAAIIDKLVTDTAARLLEESGFRQPPVNPLLIGAAHETYFMVRSLPDDTSPEYKSLKHGESWIITLNENLPPESQTVAASRAIAGILIDIPTELEDCRDEIIEQGAAEILMPRPWFEETIKSFGYDVAALKRRFGVPPDVVALRTLHFRPAILTVFEDKEVVKRIASHGLEFRPEPSLAEMEILQRAIETSTYQRASDSNGLIECQPIPQASGPVRVYCFRVPR